MKYYELLLNCSYKEITLTTCVLDSTRIVNIFGIHPFTWCFCFWCLALLAIVSCRRV